MIALIPLINNDDIYLTYLLYVETYGQIFLQASTFLFYYIFEDTLRTQDKINRSAFLQKLKKYRCNMETGM